jgi:hypothetical protein
MIDCCLVVSLNNRILRLFCYLLLHRIRIHLYKSILTDHLHENNHHSQLFSLEIGLQKGYVVILYLAVIPNSSLQHRNLLFEAKETVVQTLLMMAFGEKTEENFT